MRLSLALTWDPRGELTRLQRHYAALRAPFADVVISLPPHTAAATLDALAELPDLVCVVNAEWSRGRFTAIERAVQAGAEAVIYADLDRLLRWIETRPAEWQATLAAVPHTDCLIVGRTPAAYATHPRALRETEALSNAVGSDLLGLDIDLSAGVKIFSRRAAQVILDHATPHWAMGADVEWPVLIQRAGYTVETCRVDGLDWESADRYRDGPADPTTQQRAAEAYDQDPAHWAQRVAVAQAILTAALAAARHPLPGDRRN